MPGLEGLHGWASPPPPSRLGSRSRSSSSFAPSRTGRVMMNRRLVTLSYG